MRNIVFLIAAVIVLSSCKKSYHKNVSDFFMVTFEGTSFPCTGVKSWINEDDLDRLNLVLDIGAKYKGTAIGLVGLNGTYKKGDTIKVYVSRYKVP